jgi:hypothetical protein
VASQPGHVKEQGDAKSRAPTATTLHMKQWIRASAPSVVSRADTIHPSDHERLEILPPPQEPVLESWKARKKRRIAEHEDRLVSLSGYSLYQQHNGNPPMDSNELSLLKTQVSNLEDELQEQIDIDWENCYTGNMEVICPYCYGMLSSATVMSKHKWM